LSRRNAPTERLKTASRDRKCRAAERGERAYTADFPAIIRCAAPPQEFLAVPDPFDAYREALVMETTTIWPPEFDDLPPAQKTDLEARLHADPEKCAHLDYLRTHTGFCRQVTVTAADVQRLKG
jgi:hypothetical protein